MRALAGRFPGPGAATGKTTAKPGRAGEAFDRGGAASDEKKLAGRLAGSDREGKINPDSIPVVGADRIEERRQNIRQSSFDRVPVRDHGITVGIGEEVNGGGAD